MISSSGSRENSSIKQSLLMTPISVIPLHPHLHLHPPSPNSETSQSTLWFRAIERWKSRTPQTASSTRLNRFSHSSTYTWQLLFSHQFFSTSTPLHCSASRAVSASTLPKWLTDLLQISRVFSSPRPRSSVPPSPTPTNKLLLPLLQDKPQFIPKMKIFPRLKRN